MGEIKNGEYLEKYIIDDIRIFELCLIKLLNLQIKFIGGAQ